MASYICVECGRDTDSPICEDCGQPTERLDETVDKEDQSEEDALNSALPLEAAESDSWDEEDANN